VNRALEQAGHAARVDHRSLKDQGIDDRLPQIHLGVAAAGMIERAAKREAPVQHPRVERFQEIQQCNDRVAALDREIAEDRARLEAEAEAEAEAERRLVAERQQLEAEAATAEKIRLEAEAVGRQRLERQRQDWGGEMTKVAAAVLKVVQQATYESKHYRIVYKGDTLSIEAKDGRGVLVQRQGDQLFVSDQITEADRDYFHSTGQKLAALQQQQLTQEDSKRSKPQQSRQDGH